MPGDSMKLLVDHLRVGTRYRVTYQITGVQRKPRMFVGDWMGVNDTINQLEFSLRPEAGTTAVDPEWIIKIEAVDASTPVRLPE